MRSLHSHSARAFIGAIVVFALVLQLGFVRRAVAQAVSEARDPARSASAVAWCRKDKGEPPLRTLNGSAAARLSELVAGSGTTREMLAFLCSHSDIHLTLRGSPTLRRTRGSGGRSQFFVSDATLVGRLQFDTGDTRRRDQRIALAHEIAHAVELAALPRAETRVLATLLLARMGHHTAWWSHHPIETPFALAVEAQVAREIQTEEAKAGSLGEIARDHRLELKHTPTNDLP